MRVYHAETIPRIHVLGNHGLEESCLPGPRLPHNVDVTAPVLLRNADRSGLSSVDIHTKAAPPFGQSSRS